MTTSLRLARVSILLVTAVLHLSGQTSSIPDQPSVSVQRFKQAIDSRNIAAMCALMAEPDSSGPLQLEHYESTQASLEGLITFWQGQSFSYDAVTIHENAKIPSATITVTIARRKHSAVFSLLRFGQGWYIRDIEIYFR